MSNSNWIAIWMYNLACRILEGSGNFKCLRVCQWNHLAFFCETPTLTSGLILSKRLRFEIIFADSFYHMILSDHFHSVRSVVFFAIAWHSWKTEIMPGLSRGSESSNSPGHETVDCFFLRFFLVVLFFLLTTWRWSELLSEFFHWTKNAHCNCA